MQDNYIAGDWPGNSPVARRCSKPSSSSIGNAERLGLGDLARSRRIADDHGERLRAHAAGALAAARRDRLGGAVAAVARQRAGDDDRLAVQRLRGQVARQPERAMRSSSPKFTPAALNRSMYSRFTSTPEPRDDVSAITHADALDRGELLGRLRHHLVERAELFRQASDAAGPRWRTPSAVMNRCNGLARDPSMAATRFCALVGPTRSRAVTARP